MQKAGFLITRLNCLCVYIFQTMVPLGFLLQPSSPLLLVQLSLSFSCSAAGAAAVLIKEDADSTFIKNVNFDLQGTF